MFVQTKLQFQAVLDQIFPKYCGVFGTLYSDISLLLTLQAFPTVEEVLKAGKETIANKIKELCKSRSQQWANNQAEKLMAAANQNPFQKNLYHSLSLSLNMYINMLLEYKKHLSKLENEIDALAESIEEYKIIQSIPGIGEIIVAAIFSPIPGMEMKVFGCKLLMS